MAKIYKIFEHCELRSRSQYRRVASGGAMPPDFRFCPPDLFLAPPTVFFGRKKLLFLAGKKTLKFAISARKSLRISAKTFSFFFLEITCFWPEKTLKLVISAKKSLRKSAKTFAPPDFNFAPPPDLAKLATPLSP